MDRLKSMRVERGLSQRDLAKMVGVSRTIVQCWEAGTKNPAVATLRRLAAALNTTVGDLLGEIPDSAGGAA